MKIKSVRLKYHPTRRAFCRRTECPPDCVSLRTCRPGLWYDEQTARLMERAVRLLADKGRPPYSSDDFKWQMQLAKLTEKKTGN